MTGDWVYPRLPADVAEQLLQTYSGLPPVELRSHAALAHQRASWYPTGPRRAQEEVLAEIQQTVRKIADDYGWPEPLNRLTGTAFDRAVSADLYRLMRIVPADAASEDVWSFLSLVVLPDIAFWRWPNPNRTVGYERLIGRPRNVFRRLWTRIHILGEDLGSRLLEDEAVAILERTIFGADPRTAKVVAAAHVAVAGDITARTALLRVTALKLRRLAVLVCLESLTDAELAAVIDEVVVDALATLRDRRAAQPQTEPTNSST